MIYEGLLSTAQAVVSSYRVYNAEPMPTVLSATRDRNEWDSLAWDDGIPPPPYSLREDHYRVVAGVAIGSGSYLSKPPECPRRLKSKRANRIAALALFDRGWPDQSAGVGQSVNGAWINRHLTRRLPTTSRRTVLRSRLSLIRRIAAVNLEMRSRGNSFSGHSSSRLFNRPASSHFRAELGSTEDSDAFDLNNHPLIDCVTKFSS